MASVEQRFCQVNKSIMSNKPHLKHVEISHDGSRPMIEKGMKIKKQDKSREKMLGSINSKQFKLKHGNLSHDASKPMIDRNLHIAKGKRMEFLSDVKKGAHLKHVQPTHDASAPKIERGGKIQKSR